MVVSGINFAPLLKAFEKFEKFRLNVQDEQNQAGAIQAFEYCFELSWKMMQRLLGERGKIANSPRETFRMAVLENFIEDPEIWFEFLKMRNLTVHTYQESEAMKVIGILPMFSEAMNNFCKNIGIHAVRK